MSETHWERMEPALPCASPDGHEWTDEITFRHPEPVASHCWRCGATAEIVAFEGRRD